MKIFKASNNDINEIVLVYHSAIKHMRNEKNMKQWSDDDKEFIKEINRYIIDKNFYIVKEKDEVIGFFAMIFGIDKTYKEIRNGKWINDETYITVHKIASKYYKRHIATFIMDYVSDVAKKHNIYNIRIDTHKDNISMQTFLNKKEFKYCGIISITCDFNDDNSLRLAYLKQLY